MQLLNLNIDDILNKFLHTGPRPKKSAVSVYIGPGSVEIVQIRRDIKGPSIVKSIHKDIPKEEVTGETIKGIFQSEGITETSVTTTIPEEAIMLRRFSMPIIPPQERADAVRFEAKRHIPFNIEEVFSSFHILREDRPNNQMEVLFVGVKKDEINYILDILGKADLTVEKIEPISLALIKSLILSGNLETTSPPTAILHFVGKKRAQIIIVENSIPYIKREVSLIEKEGIEENQLLNELRLSASYYKREFSDKEITKLIICGLKEQPAWLTTIKSTLNIPVDQAAPLKYLTGEDLPVPQQEVAIGLAGRRLERPAIDLNLLPKGLVPVKYNIQKIITVEICIGIAILVLVSFMGIPSSFKLNRKIASLQKAKTECPDLNLTAESTEALKMTKEALRQRRNILATFRKQRINWYDKLTKLSELIPKEAWITQLTLGDAIGIIGKRLFILKGSIYTKDSSKNIELTNNFFQKLKEDHVFMDGFKRINLGTIVKTEIEEHEIVDFDISATED